MQQIFDKISTNAELSKEEVIQSVKQLVAERANDIFLMTTADYSIDKFIEIGKTVRQFIPSEIRLVANI